MNRKNINRKTVSFSRTEQVHVIKPCDLNGGGRLFGGALLSMLDEIAGIVAKRHSGCNNVTTAAPVLWSAFTGYFSYATAPNCSGTPTTPLPCRTAL